MLRQALATRRAILVSSAMAISRRKDVISAARSTRAFGRTALLHLQRADLELRRGRGRGRFLRHGAHRVTDPASEASSGHPAGARHLGHGVRLGGGQYDGAGLGGILTRHTVGALLVACWPSFPRDDEWVGFQGAATFCGRAGHVLAPPFLAEGVPGVAAGAVDDQALAEIDGGDDQPGQARRLLASGDACECQVEVVLQPEHPGVERAVAVVVPGPADVSGLALEKGGRAPAPNRSLKLSSLA